MKTICGLLFISVFFGLSVFATDTEPKNYHVQIVAKKNGATVSLYAHLIDCTEATITLTMNLEDMTAVPPVPLTVDSLGKQDFLLTTIHPTVPKKAHKYSYQYHSQIGRRLPLAPFPVTYALPYVDQEFTVLQGPLGKFSHNEGSSNENAIDWDMPIGTTVCAARGGIVVALRQDSDIGGKDEKYVHDANHVVIKHDDNTFAEYSHLKKSSVLVTLGQKVKVHEPLGESGNTGLSSTPHLHFAVYYTIDGLTKKTIPIQFATKTGNVTLKAGDRY